MALHAIESQRLGLKKEATRGTYETAPAKWHPTRGPVELDYGPQHLEDNAIRGILASFPPVQGINVGQGKIPLYLDAQTAGEYFYSLLGANSAALLDTTAYKHTMTRSGILLPSYTFFVDRSLDVFEYNRGTVKKLMLKGGVDNLIEMDAEVLFESEQDAGDIGSPSFATQRFLGFNNVTFSVAGSENNDVKEWEISIDNGAFAHRALTQSRDLQDIVAPSKLMIEGSFTIYFQSITERDKFLANTAVALRMLAEGATIESTFKYTVDVNIYAAHYSAYPFRADNGLLAAQVQWKGHYSSASSKAIQVDITNTETSY